MNDIRRVGSNAANAGEWIALKDVPKHLPGRRRHLATIYRWANPGLRSGQIRLQTARIGGEVFTTPEWIDNFVSELSNRPPKIATDERASRASEKLREELRRRK